MSRVHEDGEGAEIEGDGPRGWRRDFWETRDSSPFQDPRSGCRGVREATFPGTKLKQQRYQIYITHDV